MNRLMYFLFALLLAMLTGCFEPEPGPLVFFGVKTNPAEIVPGGLLGQVRLSGQLQDILADEVDEIADYGFRWSADRTALEQQQGAITTLSLGPYQGGATTFDTLSPPMEPDRIYYFQAYAIGYEVDWETGERREVYGEIESTTLEIQLQLDYTHRTNDVAFLRLMITGLNARNAKAENVYLLFGPDSTITSAMAYPYGPVTSDTVVLDTFPELAFNTTYYAQAVLDASQDYRGDWVPVAITDGWREVTGLAGGLKNALVVVEAAQALLIGGCDEVDDICNTVDISPMVWSFDPLAADGAGTWSTHTIPLNDPDAIKFEQGMGGIIDGEAYGGAGRTQTGPNFNWYNYTTGHIIGPANYCESVPVPLLYNGVSFVQNGRLYFGTGIEGLTGRATGQFWELKPGEDCTELRRIKTLPIRQNEEDRYAGREGAIVLTATDESGELAHYIAFGHDEIIQYQDVYRFRPPESASDSGAWTFVDFFTEAPARHEAMSINTEGGRAFFGFGYSYQQGYLGDFWEFDPGHDPIWIPREPFPGTARRSGVGFAVQDRTFIATGMGARFNGVSIEVATLPDCWRYYPPNN